MEEIRILQWNARSLLKRSEFREIILEHEYHLACVQETHLKTQTLLQYLSKQRI